MRAAARILYTLAELKAQHPDAYAKVLSRWQDACDQDSAPWSDETMDSLQACVKACGATLKDWSIGAYAHSSVTVEADDETDEGTPKDVDWLLLNVLKPHGYTDENGAAAFPGICAWTGYCADDAMIESVHRSMVGGSTLTEALEGLADVAREEFEQNAEQARDAESMEANWGGSEYDAEGRDA